MTAPRPMLTGGFADPVLDSQACFRAVLDAMARPGTLHTVDAPAEPPPPLARATAAVLLTLVDADTPLWLDAGAAAASEWLAFHCGAPRTELPQAAFALAVAPLPLDGLHAGSDDEPEGGATLIQQVAAFGRGTRLRVEGPGLAAPTHVQVEGLIEGFAAAWARNHARFPRGVDLVLCAGDQVMAFPRTLRIEEG